jgi:hypothetical protein
MTRAEYVPGLAALWASHGFVVLRVFECSAVSARDAWKEMEVGRPRVEAFADI